MKFYRGPSTTPFSDSSHELVDNRLLLTGTNPWHKEHVVRANISKDATERRSVSHVVVEANDVLHLHQGLIAGLLERSNELEFVKLQVLILSNALKNVQHRVIASSWSAEKLQPREVLQEIEALAEVALHKAGIDEAAG